MPALTRRALLGGAAAVVAGAGKPAEQKVGRLRVAVDPAVGSDRSVLVVFQRGVYLLPNGAKVEFREVGGAWELAPC